jgi:hypothetical protein
LGVNGCRENGYNFDAAGLRKVCKGNIKMDYKEVGYEDGR